MQRGVHCPRRHLNRFQYTCPQCGLRFMQHVHLNQHRIRRHGLYCFTNTVKLKPFRSSQTASQRFFRRIHKGKEVSASVTSDTCDEVEQGHSGMCEHVRSPGSRDSGIDESSPSCRGDETNSDVSPVHHLTEAEIQKLPNNIDIISKSAHTSRSFANYEQDFDSELFGCITNQYDAAIAGLSNSFVPSPNLVTTLAYEQYEDVNQCESLLCDGDLTQHGQKGGASFGAIAMASVRSASADTGVPWLHDSRTEPCSAMSVSGGNKTCIAACDIDNGVAGSDLCHAHQPQSQGMDKSPSGDCLLGDSAGMSGAGMVTEHISEDDDSQTVSYEYDEGCGHLSDFDTETSDNAIAGCSKIEVPCQTSFFATVVIAHQDKALDNILLDVNGNGQCHLCPKHSSTDCKICNEASYRESIGSLNTSSIALLPLINGDDPQLSACPESELNLVQSQELQCSSDTLMPPQMLPGIDSFSCVGDSSSIRMVDLGHDLLASSSSAALPQLECFQFDDRDAWMSNDEDSAPAAVPMFYIGDNAESPSTSSDHRQDEIATVGVDSVQTTKGTETVSDDEHSSASFASEFFRFLKQRETKRLTRSVSISHVRNKLKTELKDEYSPVLNRRDSCFESYNLRPKRRNSTQCECCMCDRPSEPAKPFRANTFIKSQLQVNSLRRKVVQLFDILFPDLEYPQRFSPDSPAVETLMDKVMAVVQDHEPTSAVPRPRRTITSSGECRVVLCKSPLQCLRRLRRKVCRMLQVLLPDLKFDGTFECQSVCAEQLLQEVIASNLANPKT